MRWSDLRTRIPRLDEAAMVHARNRQQQLTKPPGSLGRLEDVAVHLAGIQATPRPRVQRKVFLVMAGDHGVTAEGVSPYPSEVTAQMVLNFLRGGAAISVLARWQQARLWVVDVGVDADLPEHPGLWIEKVRRGTGNIAREPAMRREEAEAALDVGVRAVERAAAEAGMDVLVLGEMGIGNTTPATALAAVFTGQPVERLVGRGTGLDDAGLARKRAVIERALALHQPDPRDPVAVLAAVGGLEIAALAGAMLAAAARRVPVMLDGFIATAAALVATALAPRVRDYLIPGHRSAEGGHGLMLAHLGLEPLLQLGMRLGEGTGAAVALAVVEAACRLHNEMATFAEAGVSEAEA
ncbi:MAG: nicotinate-nucleotide--dimethylbenzimidazole phosphoribosyltransferase [Chloroflexi bacterium]|nr:nicotinate-nucleotide--dimethylbenzimidazole phosphoribosyltransferase [Chloroflexota bacterium]